MAELLNRLGHPDELALPVIAPDWLRMEHAVSLGEKSMQELATIGDPSGFTCPDCGGALFELHDGRPVRLLCHIGHAFSLHSLAATQEQATDEALWSGLRALQEKEALLRRLVRERGMADAGTGELFDEAERLARFIEEMRRMVSSAPSATLNANAALDA